MAIKGTAGDVGILREDHEILRRLVHPRSHLPAPLAAESAEGGMEVTLVVPGSPDTNNAWGWTQAILGSGGTMLGGTTTAGSDTCGAARDLPGAALVVYGAELSGVIGPVLVRLYVDFWATLGASASAEGGGVVYAWNALTGQGFDGASASASLGGAVQFNAGTASLAAGTIVRIHQRTLPGGTRLSEFTTGGGLAAGTTQYQVLSMVTATTYGWDWLRAHA